jgi:hypothetical protein
LGPPAERHDDAALKLYGQPPSRIPKVPDIIPQAATLAEQPHEAIQSSYRSRYRLARLSAISENQLSRFTHDKVGLSLSSIDRLCRAFGLELRPKDE